MEKQILFNSITPEQFENNLFTRFKSEIETLKAEFQPKEPTEFLTRDQVRKLFNVDLSTVHNWTKKGKLQAYGISGRVYYKRSEVEQAIKPLTV